MRSYGPRPLTDFPRPLTDVDRDLTNVRRTSSGKEIVDQVQFPEKFLRLKPSTGFEEESTRSNQGREPNSAISFHVAPVIIS